jgi:hypothetical protein
VRQLTPSRSRRHAAQRGQAIALAAAFFVALTGIAGIVMDGGHDYLTKRQAQAAADFSALAAGKQLALFNSFLNGPPTSNSKIVIAAHDYASLNGFDTVYSTACDVVSGTSMKTSWYDAGFSCGSSNYNTRVDFAVPALAQGGQPLPTKCQPPTQYNCVQVTVTQKISHWFMGAFGIPYAYVQASATVFAHPPGSSFNTPPPNAVYLYEPVACATQCFDITKVPQRKNMTCSTSGTGSDPANNCPTFWVRPGATPLISGIDGTVVQPPADQVALEVNGHTVIQAATTICDPYNGATCAAGTATGNMGFARNGGSIFCSTVTGSLLAPGCLQTAPQTGLATVYTRETAYQLNTWSPVVDTSSLPLCGALVLNGDNVPNSYTKAGSIGPSSSACYPPATEPYTLQPGIYQYIVINHGSYHFEAGVYDITSKAPVNTVAAGFANGIDHRNEVAADWDLCPAGSGALGCPNLTAGVWIGHGGGSFTAATAGTASNCAFTGGGTPGVQGGGGDPTDVGATSVAIRFESNAGGFVSTNEVHSIVMTSPGLGQVSIIGGVPILFDLENNQFIHLDAIGPGGRSNFTGLVYQTQSATAGGVEINPGLAGGMAAGSAALTGQVRAYSLTFFGTSGKGVSFKNGYGTSAVPPVTTSGFNESWIIGTADMSAAITGTVGMETFHMQYVDEWGLDAYGLYVKVNNGSPIFFSKGIWNPTPGPAQPVPPATNNPGDANPRYPDPAVTFGNYTTIYDSVPPYNGGNPNSHDWSINIPNGTANPTVFEVNGSWLWGHESEITGTTPNWSMNLADIYFTFPTPNGATVNIQVFMTDGDFCGDYAMGNFTFNNIGQPNGGLQAGASVSIVL